jgi:peroxiredoxin
MVLTGCGKPAGKLRIGEKVADFRLDTIKHERFYLNQHKGKVVVLVFWATWCRPCKTQILEMRSFTGQPGWQDVVTALICTDPENFDQVKSIAENLEITYPVLMDHEAGLFRRFRLIALPTTLIIDQKQRLVYFKTGYDPVMINHIKTKIVNLLSRHVSIDVFPERISKSFDQTFSKVWPPAGLPKAKYRSIKDKKI